MGLELQQRSEQVAGLLHGFVLVHSMQSVPLAIKIHDKFHNCTEATETLKITT